MWIVLFPHAEKMALMNSVRNHHHQVHLPSYEVGRLQIGSGISILERGFQC